MVKRFIVYARMIACLCLHPAWIIILMPSKVWYQHIEAWTKCPPFLRLHIHRYLLEWQLFDYNWNFRVFVGFFRDGQFFFGWIYEYNLVSTGWVNGLALSRPQGTTWTSDDRDHGRQMVSLGHTLIERFMGRQDPGGPHVGPMNFAIWTMIKTVLIPTREDYANIHSYPALSGYNHIYLFYILCHNVSKLPYDAVLRTYTATTNDCDKQNAIRCFQLFGYVQGLVFISRNITATFAAKGVYTKTRIDAYLREFELL